MADTAQPQVSQGHGLGGHDGETRRDFLLLTAGALGGVGAAIAVWPFIDSLNPARDTLALASTEVDLAPVQVGQRLTVAWRGKPVFIDHRTPEQIKAAQDVNLSDLRDPQADSARVKKADWLVIIGVCTHLGCTPNWLEAEQKFKCPCHGSGYYKTGVNFEGPTPRPLERYAISLADDGQILVDKSRKFQEEKGEWDNPAAFLKL